MYINGTFRFHKVGQGLFYSGILTKTEGTQHNTFSFIYDCGSESSNLFLYQEIDEFKQLFPSKKRKLNMLVISHLHEDHINGLEHLLDDFEVETVVMPYVHDGLKLLARLELHSDNEFLNIFLTDPIAWFVSKGAKRILLLGSEGIEDFDSDNRSNSYEDQDLYFNGVLRIDVLDNTQIVYLNNNSTIECWKFYWKFCFENLELKANKERSYIEIVEKFKKQKCLTLEQVFKSKRLSDELRRELEKSYPNAQNRTSVILLHGPAPQKYPCLIYFINNFHPFLYKEHEICNTILTGDIELTGSENLKLLDNDYVFLFQFPHHGSKNKNLELLSKSYGIVNVISCGIINRYGHPHDKVLKQLHHVALVNERNAFDYQIVITECQDSK